MNKVKLKFCMGGFLIFAAVILNCYINFKNNEKLKQLEKEISNVTVVDTVVHKNAPLTLQNIEKFIKFLNIKYADIAFAQVVLETGNLTDSTMLGYNNLFGMKCAKQRPTNYIDHGKHGYAVYKYWEDSVIDYALFCSKYCKSDMSRAEWLQYLDNNYSEDVHYSAKLEDICKQWEYEQGSKN